MVVKKCGFLVTSLILASCASAEFDVAKVSAVYVADFHSDDMKTCGPNDVDLTHAEAAQFFRLAKVVDARTLHDHYEYAPCYVEGTLRYQEQSCSWRIRAGATGSVTCGKESFLFACDTCEAIFDQK